MLPLLLAGLTVAGCAPRPYLFDPDRAARYLEHNTDVPDDTARALLSGRIVQGMTKQEVALCMGKRCEKTAFTEEGVRKEVWRYFAPRRDRDDLQGSNMWHEEKSPVATIVFGPDGRVERYRFFSGFRGPRRPTGRGDDGSRREPAEPEGPGLDRPDAGDDESGPPPAESPRDTAGQGDRQALTREQPARGGAGSGAPPRRTARSRGHFAGWPALTLDGISRGGKEPPLAIIDRQVVAAGQSIAGVKVLAVESDGVLLQRGQDVQFLPTGESTVPAPR